MTSWSEFLKESDAEMRRQDLHRGLSWTPAPGDTTAEAVADYCQGFAWNGIGAREVVRMTNRSERSVKRALATLVHSGQLQVSYTETRGPRATLRKVYHSGGFKPVIDGDIDTLVKS